MATINIDKLSWEKGFNDGKSGLKSTPTGDSYSYCSGYIEGKADYEKNTNFDKLVDINSFRKNEIAKTNF